ncbi:MAG: prepilin-type N-terminal cleavage/methylation domain-containing protein [Candidatus Paceibacteria bacterium]|jgi:prepilin-type N-terminal cleavage/methylation domain-containing protein
MLYKRGFTLIEILVVISIIAILLTVGSISYGEVRENARDAQRVTDIEQIGLALRLYVQDQGSLPDCDTGIVLETGRGSMYVSRANDCPDELLVKQYLTDYFGEIPTDPAGPGDDDYYYYYDSSHNCFSGVSAAMVFAVNLESRESNATSACEFSSGNDGGYLNTAEINPSQPYVYLIQ